MTNPDVNALVERPYWLCCGSRDEMHSRGCAEHLIGHPERRRFGTASEHSAYQIRQQEANNAN